VTALARARVLHDHVVRFRLSDGRDIDRDFSLVEGGVFTETWADPRKFVATAYHEAAHAVVVYQLAGNVPRKISVIPGAGAWANPVATRGSAREDAKSQARTSMEPQDEGIWPHAACPRSTHSAGRTAGERRAAVPLSPDHPLSGSNSPLGTESRTRHPHPHSHQSRHRNWQSRFPSSCCSRPSKFRWLRRFRRRRRDSRSNRSR